MSAISGQSYEFSVILPRAAAEALAVALEELTAAVGLLDLEPEWKVEAWFETPPDKARLDELIRAANGGQAAEFSMTLLDQQDWVAKSLAGLKPVRIGPFAVHGSHESAGFAANLHRIVIDAGLAFGTGHHGTTAACLMALDRHLKQARPENVLDLGTGSGLLAIAAAKILRREIIASDIDPMAVEVAAANAGLNGVAPLLRPFTASGFHHPEFAARGPFDLILANILAGPLTRLAPDIRRHLCPGGTVILSGLLNEQAARVLAAYRIQNIVPTARIDREGWTTLTLRKAAS